MKRIIFAILALAGIFTCASARQMKDLKIYINPGHGGYTANDRPVRIHPFASNDTLGYWESKSNLYKGLHMYHILDSLGTTAYLSRTKNTEADDRSLSGIASEATNLGVDMFLSIHSNAGESVNYPLMLYREQTKGTPRYPKSVELSNIIWENLHSNQMREWTHNSPAIAGDLTFYQNMWEGGLGVLRTLYVVGLLSEGSMHEHRPEAHKLMNDDVLWLEAWHFVRSIMEFFNTEDRFVTGNVAGFVYDDHRLREAVMPVNFSRYGRDKLAPLNGASVELLDMNGNVVQKRTTDDMYNGCFVFRNVTPGTYKVRAWRDDYHMMENEVTVVANDVTYNDFPLVYKRDFPVEITAYSPADNSDAVSCSSTVDFTFNTDIDTESFEKAFSITPDVAGYFTYSESYTKASFHPTIALERDMDYTVKVSTELTHTDHFCANANMQQPIEFKFKTAARNRLEMTSHYPADGGTVHAVKPTFEFRFDYPVDPATIFNAVSLKDANGNAIAINQRNTKYNRLSNGFGNVVYAINGNLTPGMSYTLSLTTELRDRENLPLSEGKVVHFTAIDAAADVQGEVIDEFDNSDVAFAYDPDQTTGTGSTTPAAVRTTTDKLFGQAAAKLTYKFTDTHDGLIHWNYIRNEAHTFTTGQSAELFINGDLNGHELQLAFTAGSDTKYASLCNIDFLGWERHTVELNMLEAGVPYVFSGVRLVQADGAATLQGSICLDNLARVGTGAGVVNISAADNGLDVHFDANTSTIYVNGDSTVKTLEIFNTAGLCVLSSKAATINIANVPNGIYLLRVSAQGEAPVVLRIAKH